MDGKYEKQAFNVNNKRFSSKNGRHIVQFFKSNFPNDDWKSGGLINIGDNNLLSRDLWSDKLKVCFEYDGIWHFKDIHGQLETKHKKDILLEKWCRDNGYRLIRVDEEHFKNVEQIVDLVYNNSDSLIKIGDRYNNDIKL